MNYIILLVLYSLQGIPMGLSLTVPFLLQRSLSSSPSLAATTAAAATAATGWSKGEVYGAQAVFALASFPFSVKLLWAPIVDGLNVKFPKLLKFASLHGNGNHPHRAQPPPKDPLPPPPLPPSSSSKSKQLQLVTLPGTLWGRRKAWLIPVQILAGGLMVSGASLIDSQLALASSSSSPETWSALPLTKFFFALYLLMATQVSERIELALMKTRMRASVRSEPAYEASQRTKRASVRSEQQAKRSELVTTSVGVDGSLRLLATTKLIYSTLFESHLLRSSLRTSRWTRGR